MLGELIWLSRDLIFFVFHLLFIIFYFYTASTFVSTEAQTDSPQSNSALPSGTDSPHSTILTTDISSLQDPTTTQLVSTPDVVISPTKPQNEPTTKRATQGGSTESAGIATTETSIEDDAVDNVNLATTSLLPISQGIATDDVSLTPADVSITANMTGGSGHDTTEDAREWFNSLIEAKILSNSVKYNLLDDAVKFVTNVCLLSVNGNRGNLQ